MRHLRYILPVLIAALFLGGCRSANALKRQKGDEEQEGSRLIRTLVAPPPVSELTASLSFNINGNKVSGQLRMRRGRSIQLSASVLGLMEMARIEFFPDMVVVMDRYHNLYSVCHYADIPHRNELGFDFEEVQALLWNRIFCPGFPAEEDAVSRLEVTKADEAGKVRIKEKEYGYTFVTDGNERLESIMKSSGGYSFRMDYSDFTALSGSWRYPLELSVEITSSGVTNNVSVKMSSVSVEKKNWADRTQVTRRMKQVSLDELLDNLDL
jgi:hypothetical protein